MVYAAKRVRFSPRQWLILAALCLASLGASATTLSEVIDRATDTAKIAATSSGKPFPQAWVNQVISVMYPYLNLSDRQKPVYVMAFGGQIATSGPDVPALAFEHVIGAENGIDTTYNKKRYQMHLFIRGTFDQCTNKYRNGFENLYFSRDAQCCGFPRGAGGLQPCGGPNDLCKITWGYGC